MKAIRTPLAALAASILLVALPSAAFAAEPADSVAPVNPPPFTPADGRQLVTVPDGVQAVEFVATGGAGGDASRGASGGRAAVTTGRFYVSPGQQFEVAAGQAGMAGAAGWGPGEYVGGAPGAPGWNDSDGPVTAGGGGGASAIFVGDSTVTVAAGGGGAGGSANANAVGPGAHPAGGNGGSAGATPTGGDPGTSLAGGNQGEKAGGAGGAVGGGSGEPGGPGAAAATDTASGQTWGQGGGGGGGGPLGGGGGGVASTTQTYGSGGGGGAAGQSLNAPSIFDGSISTSAAAGDGSVQISWMTDVSPG